MKSLIRYRDHRSKHNALIHWVLFVFDLVVLGIFIPTFYEAELLTTDPIMVVIVGGIIFSFCIMPHILLKVLQKPKWSDIDSNARTIRLVENNKTIKTIPFDRIQFLSFSEYSYTVKSKNGSRTVTVYTVLGQLEGESFPIAESTNYPEVRLFGESIAKQLKTSIKQESGELVPYTDLDLPIHKRKVPKEILESEIIFSPNSQLLIENTGGISLLKSNYSPKIYTIISIAVSLALTLIIHFVFGSLVDLSLDSWESIPPNTEQIVFFILSLMIGFSPLIYVSWNQRKRKEIQISKDTLFFNGKAYPFQDYEEILLKNNTLYLVNDQFAKTYSLHFFCELSDMGLVRNWILKEIAKQSGGNEDLGRF